MLSSPAIPALLARQVALNEGLDPNKYLLLGWVFGSRPIGLGITLALANQEADQLPTPQTITVAAAALRITTQASLPNGVENAAYSTKLAASGGHSPVTWALTGGALPAGLTLTPDGTITGTPSSIQNLAYMFMVQVTDAHKPPATASATFSLTVVAPGSTPGITSAASAAKK